MEKLAFFWSSKKNRWVVYAMLISYGICALLSYLQNTEISFATGNFWPGFYVSWVEDALFFSIVGVAALIYSTPFDASRASFDQRVLAFYGPDAPRALRDYAKNELTRYGGYAEKVRRDVYIREIDTKNKLVKLETLSHQEITNMFDVPYHDDPTFKVTPDDFACPPQPVGMIEMITLNGTNLLKGEKTSISAKNGFAKKLEITIPSRKKLPFEARWWIWTKLNETQEYAVNRVTLEYILRVHNSPSNPSIILREGAELSNEIILEPGDIHEFNSVKNITPDDNPICFTLDIVHQNV